MTRKIESWSGDIYQNGENLGEKYENLKGRELVIVGAAVLDIGLAHLVEKKLSRINEVEAFLGLNDTGMAPLGTFGSRIQASLLLGLINQDEAIAFRAIKSIRNAFAHKVNTSFKTDKVHIEINKLIPKFSEFVIEHGTEEKKEERRKKLKFFENNYVDEMVGQNIFRITICSMQIVIDERISSTQSVDDDKEMHKKVRDVFENIKIIFKKKSAV